MIFKSRKALALLLATTATPAVAQQVWLQVEAQGTRERAIDTAQDYAAQIEDVHTLEIVGSSYYAIALGPFTENEAAARRRELRARGLIPGDSYTAESEAYGAVVWPVEADAATILAQNESETQTDAQAVSESEPAPEPDETPAEARRSEQALTREDREEIQIALRWKGYYDAAIDAAFGRGTRASMAAWQAEKGYDETGVLTTRQRAELLREYNAVLEGLGLEPVTDTRAGITVVVPSDLVAFDRYDPPFAHYEGVDGAEVEAKVLLISQEGERADLYGLYDIMQTLEIVPREGERERRESGFTLIGRGDGIVSQTEARLEDGQIKGFTLIWPANDEDRRTRVIDEMIDSFETTTSAVLPDVIGEPTEDQSVDLLAGLRIRTPAVVRSGFYVSRRGEVLTTADAVDQCERITLDDDIEATVDSVDADAGLALLTPAQALAPRQHATFLDGVPRLNTEVILSGYSFDGQLGAPSLTYGTLVAMTGLDGDEDLRRYDLSSRSGDAGGPVFDRGGSVLGMLRSAPETGRNLPDGVSFATDVDAIRDFLTGAGVMAETGSAGADLPRGQMERRATDMTVLVGCWK
ncbi:serine protease [Palleronia abyssalis]|uniref:Peptidoglycan binding-like domain-containing protein n=1 Tax=Palleronia abyssalis TaxID=1501240 RepID=A0A2R8C002_9RHOB|nr:serine protease [Palleronia abyssalis]SPJ25755.1 hypothetical protein PAA8504_03606 [Palleronia abyssalis]